uniref:Fatty acid beta-oxidation multifunctional protein I, glyoxysomal (Fragments) n=1 Tax=Cucumis sativus TaxID=3659 RepID=Q7M226_CUCSA
MMLTSKPVKGESTQKGFYLYDKNRKSKPDPE